MVARPRAVAGLPGRRLPLRGAPAAFLLTLGALVLATVLWWGITAQFAIPLVWAVAAIVTVLLADAPRLFVDDGTTWPWAIPVVYVFTAVASAR